MKRNSFALCAALFFCLLVAMPVFALGGSRVLDLRNTTGRMVWVTKSDYQQFNPTQVQWSSLASGQIGIWNVLEGGWLHVGYASSSDQGKIERIFSFQLPYHPDSRWIWKIIPQGAGLGLEADWGRL
ncbi:MAG TPA: hypothetical protein PLP89_05530 [Synergistales bacterium]|nr:hypothetical protein [Synergistales bacterium]HRV71018.1 hypothetical protein [Thermovirgaceae bacterium]